MSDLILQFQGVNKSGSVGLPLPGTVIEIVDRQSGRWVKPAGSATDDTSM